MPTPYRAEVVGSMLRPEELRHARQELDDGRIGAEEFKTVEDRAVDEVIAIQERAGVDVVTDGEVRRFLFTGPISEAVEGMTLASDHTAPWHDAHGENFDQPLPVIVDKLRLTKSLATDEFLYASQRANRPLKVTIPSPLTLVMMWSPKHSADAYPDPFDMFSDVLDILREEVRSLAAAGCRYIQVDAPEAATLVDPEVRAWFAGNGVEPERFLTEGMDLVNELPRAVSEDVYWGVHLCRGNNQGGWMGTGGYEQIAEPVFSRVSNYDAVLLEYDDQRSGGFEPLSHLPDDIVAVLGLISSKQARIESAGDIRRRVEEAGRVRPHDTLALSTQCGFASIVFGNPIDEETQEAKLRLVAELAHELW